MKAFFKLDLLFALFLLLSFNRSFGMEEEVKRLLDEPSKYPIESAIDYVTKKDPGYFSNNDITINKLKQNFMEYIELNTRFSYSDLFGLTIVNALCTSAIVLLNHYFPDQASFSKCGSALFLFTSLATKYVLPYLIKPEIRENAIPKDMLIPIASYTKWEI